MAPSSSGGTTVGEALNILEQLRLGGSTDAQALHHYLEASALAFADRNRYVGDPPTSASPLQRRCCSRRFAAERACLIDPDHGAAQAGRRRARPTAYGRLRRRRHRRRPATAHEGLSTTNLTVADRWGNVVEYTLTIEQTGGNAMVVPGPRVPAQQRADRLQLHAAHARRARPEPAGAGQAAAQLDVADDRAAATAGRSSPSARRAARRSSRPCCRSWSTGSTSG